MVVRDASGRLLLFEGADPAVPDVRFWITPGGGVADEETFEEAAQRELLEETGLVLTRLGDSVWEEEVEFSFEGVTYRQRQRFYGVELPADSGGLDVSGWTDYERRWMAAYRWWTLDELEETTEAVYPPGLADLARSISSWGTAELKSRDDMPPT